MLGNDRLARAISDVAWGNFLLTLRSKAESAGVAFVEVNARGTSQECSACGRLYRKTCRNAGTPATAGVPWIETRTQRETSLRAVSWLGRSQRSLT